MLTQNQADALLDAFMRDYAGKRVSYYGYAGECLSLAKLWVDTIKNGRVGGKKHAPASGNGKGSGYYTNFNSLSLLKELFIKEPFVARRKYPRGSLVVYTKTSHIAIFLEGGVSSATLFEQNADPDGSPAGTHQRANSRIDGVLVLRTAAPTVSRGNTGKTVYLNKRVSSWRVYRVGSSPPRTPVGILNPRKFGGLSYKILADDKAGVVIQTQDFGRVCLPIDSDATIK